MVLWVKEDGQIAISVATKAEAKRVIKACGSMTMKEIIKTHTGIKGV